MDRSQFQEFVRKIYPKASEMPTTDHRFGMTTAIDDIHHHMDFNNDWEFEKLFFRYLDFLNVPDENFKYLLEQMVHPSIRRFDLTEDYEKIFKDNSAQVNAINKYLTADGFELKATDSIVNMLIYSVIAINPGVQGNIKNILFALKYKPEIVLGDALNHDIMIVSNQDKCLVYDNPVASSGIMWKQLQDWYDEELLMLSTGVGLKGFMKTSLESVPERLFFETYLLQNEMIVSQHCFHRCGYIMIRN